MRKPRKILVVDDDPIWRDVLSEWLSELGYEPVQVKTGEEALQALDRERYAVVLLDLYMPGLSGGDVVGRLPANPPPVVLLTSAPVREAGPTLGAGARYYLPKEATRDQLSMMLESLTY